MDPRDLLQKIETVYERRRDDRDGFVQAASVLVEFEDLAPNDREQLLAHIRARAETLPVKPLTREDVANATEDCRRAAQRLRSCAGYDELIATWPAPIAHELRELVAVLEGEGRPAPSPEAALLQLRDAAEVLVKLPACVLAARVLQHDGPEALEMRRQLITVSGGAWRDVALRAALRLRQIEPDGPFTALATLFARGSRYNDALEALGQARNTYLGHGALRKPHETAAIVAWVTAAQPGETPPPDLLRRPTLVDAIESGVSARPWAGMRLEAVDDGDRVDLTGAVALEQWFREPRFADPRHVAHDDRVWAVRLVRDDGAVVLEVAPLVAARICRECGRRDVFVFDMVYDRKPWRLDCLDYGRGHKSRFKRGEASDLHAEVCAVPQPDAPPAALQAQTLESGAAVAALDRLRIDQRYISPRYLRAGFAAFLSEHDRGTYWLQAPAHVGKTMFVAGLADPTLSDGPIALELRPGPGGAIAAFYCKREYREGRYGFLNDLSEELKTALDLRRDKNVQFPEPSEVVKAQNPRAAFAAWLDHWRALAHRVDRPLLIAVDGLDETDAPASGDSLLDLLPTPADLTPGLYVLLTSRPTGDNDCHAWLCPEVEPLASATRRIGLDDPEYHALLIEHVCKTLDPTDHAREPTVTLGERLIAQAQGRFAFLSFLVEQVRGGQQLPATIAALGTGPEMYDRFFDTLEARYGAKRGDVLLDVLASLAAAELAHDWTFTAGAVPDGASVDAKGYLEPVPRVWLGLELDVLAAATDLDERRRDGGVGLSVPFVEALLLLQSALWVWRGAERAPRYRLGLKEFAGRLGTRRPDAVRRAHARLAGTCLDAIESLHAEPLNQRDPSGERTVRALFGLLPGLIELANSAPLSERFRALPVIEVARDVEFARVEAGSQRRITWCDGILAALTRGAGSARSDVDRRNEFASAYMNRGATKQDAPGSGPAAAIADYDAAIALLEATRRATGAEWPASWHHHLAGAYMNRADAKQGVPGWGPTAAIADYDVAIALREALREALGAEWPLPWRHELALSYANRGTAKQAAGWGPTSAIADYDAAIALLEATRRAAGAEWPASWHHDLAAAYVTRGNAKQAAPGWGAAAAIGDYDAAIAHLEALREALGAEWSPAWRNDLATAYVNRANAKQDAPGWGAAAAIADYDVAIALREALGAEWAPSWRNDLAAAYTNRGAAKENAPGWGPAAAIADYDVAIALREALREALGAEWPPSQCNDLAGAYVNRANAKQTAPGWGPAAATADYDVAIVLQEALREALGAEWPLPWRNELAGAYMNRGNAKHDAPGWGPAAAIADYDVAIALGEALHEALGAEWPLPWRNELAGAYMNRGNARHDGWGPAAAIADYDVAIALREALREALGADWPLPWRSDLAGAYMNRGLAKESAQAPATAIADYDAAIDLLTSALTLDEPSTPQFAEWLKLARRRRDRARSSASESESRPLPEA